MICPLLQDYGQEVLNSIVSGQLSIQAVGPSEEILAQDNYLQNRGLCRHPILGDGNCLFRAISHSLYESQQHHQPLRNLAIDTINANRHIFQHYNFTGNGQMNEDENQTYLHNLRQPNTFAGQESIMALAFALNINIQVTIDGWG